MLGATKSDFPRITEDFSYPSLFALLNSVVKILEPQPMCSARTGPTLLLPAPMNPTKLRCICGGRCHIRPVNRHINPCDFGRLQDAVLADSVSLLFVLGAFLR